MTGTTNEKKMRFKTLLRSILAIAMVATLLLGCVGMLAGCSKEDEGGSSSSTKPTKAPSLGIGSLDKPEKDKEHYESLTDEEYLQTLITEDVGYYADALASSFGAILGSGDFSIDYNKLAIEEANSTLLAEQTVTVTVNQSLSTSQALEVYVVVPAREYTKGFTLTIIDQNGHTMEVAKASSINVVAGQILSMSTPVEFEPTFTSILIDTPSKLNAFAKAFNNGEYDVDVDVKVISDLEYDATTSADFASIGNGTYVYAGVFDGGGYSIKGLTTSNSLFYLPNGATIKNVVYDQSCVITHPASLGGNWGVLGRAFQGSTKAENCVINCDVKLYYSNVASAETGLGVITGR
jgi:hypothetical protein